MDQPTLLFSFLLTLHLSVSGVISKAFTLVNQCNYSVWPGSISSGGAAGLSTSGFLLRTGESSTVDAPTSWQGRFWGRTLCTTDSNNNFSCVTGDCGSGKIACAGSGGAAPVTMAEFALDGAGGRDYYDVSVVDGFNVPMMVVPHGDNCTSTGCPGDVNAVCPPELQVNSKDGKQVVACMNACLAYRSPQYCCTGTYGSSKTCNASASSQIFKIVCPQAYSLAYDDGTSAFDCASATNYTITFCPSSNTTRVDDQNLSESDTSNKKKIVVPIVASVSSILALLVIFILIRKLRRKEQSDEEMNMPNKGGRTVASKNWQYTYAEVLNITKNFETVIGKGGFGTVYCGQMKDGKQVAVKMLSPSSSQGPKEFQTEAELLMTVHHKNLVSFIGYCDYDDKMALIYEYMANGNLKVYLSDSNSHCLSWERRLQIAIDAAEGLDYLHHGCKPPIIHRDVKSANILLSEDLEAKIADFGLSKVFRNDNRNAESAVIQNDDRNAKSKVVGTIGYLDPEYYKLRNLNEKSDIYSFGIVLLELITGQPAVLKGKQSIHILEWVRTELDRGDLSRILDPRFQGKFDASSGRKALEIAMACTASTSIQRPTMSAVLAELKQCFKMELPSHNETFVAPRQIHSEFYGSSGAYSVGSESVTYPFPR